MGTVRREPLIRVNPLVTVPFAILGCLFFIANSSAESSGIADIVFLGNYNIAPVVYLENNEPAGVAVDITRALSRPMGRPIAITAMNWQKAQELVARGEADALIQINQTEERRKIFDFSEPLLESHFSIFTKADRAAIPDLQGLRSLRVGVEAAGLPQQLLEKMGNVSIAVIPSFLEGFKSLDEGSIDAVVVDYRVGVYIIAANRLRNIKATGEPIESSYSSIAVKKGNVALLNEINRALRSIKADGTYRRILEKWKPKEVVYYSREQIANTELAGALLLAFAAIIVATVWVETLRKELRRRIAAEHELREQHSTLDSIINSVDAHVYSLNDLYEYTSFNARHAATMNALFGADIGRGGSYLGYLPSPGEREAAKANIDRTLRGERFVDEAYSGEDPQPRRYFQVSRTPIADARGKVIGVAVLGFEITERKRAEDELRRLNRELRAISKCNQVLVRAKDEQRLVEEICRIVCEDAGYRMAWVGYAEDDGAKAIKPVAWYGFEDGYLDQTKTTWDDSETGLGPGGRAIRLGESSSQDFATDPLASPWRKGALRRGYRTGIALPLKDERGMPFGVLSLLSSEPNAFTSNEKQLLEELASDLAFGIVALRALEERKRAEADLRSSEEKYRTLFEESFDGLFITSPDGKILDMNKKGIELFGYGSLGEIRSLDLARDVYAYPLDRDRILAMVNATGTAEYEVVVKRKSGQLVTTYCALTAVRDERGEIAAYRGIIRDITEIKLAEERLKESEDRYRRLTEDLTDYQYSVRVHEGRAVETSHSQGCSTVTGYDPQEFKSDPYLWFSIVHPEDRSLVQERVRQILCGLEIPPIEHRILRKGGSVRWVCDTTILRKDPADRLISYDGVIKDITERKEAERKLQNNLLEKDVLLQEVHHRVKNNLNVISSLLSLQSSFIKTPEEAIKAFEYSRDRIMAMASVHQELYQSKDYSRIDMSTYLESLARQLASLYCSNSGIVVRTEIGSLALDVGFAVPIGLILNELITNAFKHAFPKGGPGEIVISFRQDGPDFYEFSVSDNGVGMPTGVEQPRPGSLGLSLIRLLVDQIDGIASMDCKAGSSFHFRFPSKNGRE